jgi:small-conductance mechanosensitive channel
MAYMFNLLISIWIVLLLLGGSSALAQKPSPPEPQKVTAPGYPVMLGDQVLLNVHGIKAFRGDQRAAAISERIKRLAEDYAFSVDSIMVVESEISTDILATDWVIMSVFDSDAQAEKVPRKELAERYVQKIRVSIEKYRQDYSRQALFWGVFYTLIATFVLIVLIYLFNKFYRRVDRLTQAWVSSKKISLHIQSFEIIRAERIGMILTAAMKLARFFIFLVIFYTYIHLGLSFFPWTRTFANRLFDYVLVPLQITGKAIGSQIPNLIFLAIIVLITVYVLKLTRLFFNEIEKETLTFKGFYPEWAQPSYRICRLLVIAFAAVMAFPYIPGSESPAFKGISIFLGVLFSLGSTSFIANILAGYALTYRRVFKIGDRVKISDFIGDVVETKLQVTHLRTIKNEEIIVPNSMIVNSHVINYSSLAREKGLILHTTVTIGYDAPWRQVHAMLLMAAEKTPGLLHEPPPFVLQKSLDDFYVNYELNVYTDNPLEMPRLYSELHQNIQDTFNEYGVQIMSPSYRFDPDQPKVVPKDKWYAPPAKPPDDSNKLGGG